MGEKTIRSHRARVQQAKRIISGEENSNFNFRGERISIIDREAFVEYLLLEDIERLYTNRLESERNYQPKGRLDEMAKQVNIRKFTAIIQLFDAVIGSARASICNGNYKAVWKAIPEGALMAAAGNAKRLAEVREMAVEMLKELSGEMLAAAQEVQTLNESLDEIESHEKNVVSFNGMEMTYDELLQSANEIESVIREAEALIPNKKADSRLSPNIK